MSHPEPPNDNGLPEVPPQPGAEKSLPSTLASPFEQSQPQPGVGAPMGQPQTAFDAVGSPQQPSPYGPGAFSPQGPGQFQYPAASAPQPGSKKGLLIGGIIAGAIVVLLVIGGGIAFATGIFGGSNGPEATVKEYLGYLAEGDAESATKMVPIGLSGDEAVFLDPAVLKNAKELISGIEVKKSIQMGTDRYWVSYSYQLDGRTFDDQSEVFKKNGEWTIKEPVLATFSIGSFQNNFRIGDIEAPDARSILYEVYPAVYEIETPKSGFYSGETVTVTAGGYLIDSVNLDFTLSDKFHTDVQKSFNAWIDSCLTTDAFYTSDFGNACRLVSLRQYEGIANMNATVSEYPVYKFEGDSAMEYLSPKVSGGKLQLDFDAVDRYDSKNAAVQNFSIQEELPGNYSVKMVVDGSKITFEESE